MSRIGFEQAFSGLRLYTSFCEILFFHSWFSTMILIWDVQHRMCSYCGNNRLGIYNTDVVRIGGKKSKGKKRKILRKYCRSCNDMTEVPIEKIAPLRPPKKKPELLTQSKKKQKTKPSPNQPPGLASFLTKF